MTNKMEIIKRPVEQIGGEIKRAAWGAIIESLAIMVLGILFVAWPEVMMQVVTYVVGAFFIVRGAFQVVNYFIEKGHNDFFDNRLLSGVVSALIGVAALVVGQDMAQVFRIVVGIFVIYESLVRMNTAMKLQAAGVNIWKYILILALVMLVLGIFVTFNDLATVIGWMMVLAGVIGIVGDIMFIQQVNMVVDRLTEHDTKKREQDV